MNYPTGMPDKLRRCEECGESATVVVTDFDEVEPIVTVEATWLAWKHREHHAYCDAHARCSLSYRLDGSVRTSCEFAGEPCPGGAT